MYGCRWEQVLWPSKWDRLDARLKHLNEKLAIPDLPSEHRTNLEADKVRTEKELAEYIDSIGRPPKQ